MMRRPEVPTDVFLKMAITNRNSEIAVNGFRQCVELSLEVKISMSVAHDKSKDEWSMLLWVLDILWELLSQ